ncbi:MAG: tRNA (adenosine(37)-N6)-threonylcarbamoyltransferase complex dimerization subunit type 1 TsaB [Nitrospirae bacterium]|nr:tRNA (adenosine(37)-N6)-threonylcarbamoyltransferase complex dimerization subunit type 1 TsaB [Nitrospirota bacterium]
MLTLAIECAGPVPAVAMLDDTRVISQAKAEPDEKPGTVLVALLQRSIDEAGIGLEKVDLIAVDLGPGSFTGIRVALATVKALAFRRPIPAVGTSSLAALTFPLRETADAVLGLLPATRTACYAAIYQTDGIEWSAMVPEQMVAHALLPGWLDSQIRTRALRRIRSTGEGLTRLTGGAIEQLGGLAPFDPTDLARTPGVVEIGLLGRMAHLKARPLPPPALRPLYVTSPV